LRGFSLRGITRRKSQESLVSRRLKSDGKLKIDSKNSLEGEVSFQLPIDFWPRNSAGLTNLPCEKCGVGYSWTVNPYGACMSNLCNQCRRALDDFIISTPKGYAEHKAYLIAMDMMQAAQTVTEREEYRSIHIDLSWSLGKRVSAWLIGKEFDDSIG